MFKYSKYMPCCQVFGDDDYPLTVCNGFAKIGVYEIHYYTIQKGFSR